MDSSAVHAPAHHPAGRGARILVVLSLAAAVVGIEWARALVERVPGLAIAGLAGGGLAMIALGLTAGGRDRLGLSGGGAAFVAMRVIGALALTAVLLLPAAVRWHGGPVIQPPVAAAAVIVSIGEEVAFRGALYAALESAWGGAAGVLGSAAAFTLAHVLSHPAEFLPVVGAMALLLGVWRWALRDLWAPLGAHVLADLAL